MARISVLSDFEAKEFDEPPVFNSIDCKRFYDMTTSLETAIHKLKTPTNKICFLISYVYFKAEKKFYSGRMRDKDIEHACHLLDIDYENISLSSYSRNMRHYHQQIILDLFNYMSFKDLNKEELSNLIYTHIKSYKNPRLILTNMVNYFLAKKVEIPNYRRFVNLISSQVKKYKSNIHECLNNNLDKETRNQLDVIMNKDSDKGYNLNFIKNYNQSLSPGNISRNLEDFNNIKELYGLIEEPFKALNLNHDGAMYLTRFVERNKALHLSQRSDNTRYVSLIAFIAYQYFKGHDVLADILLQSVQTIKNSVREKIKDQNATKYIEQNITFCSSVEQVKSSLIPPIEEISSLASNADLSPDECLLKIKNVLSIYKEPIDNYKKSLSIMVDELSNTSTDNTYFSILETQSRKLQNRVAGIIKFIEFTGDKDLIEAIHNFQKEDIKEKTAPVKFLSKKEREHIKDDKGNFRVSLYKALLFLKIADALKSGRINLQYSYKYRHINDYLISKEKWDSKRDDYLKKSGLEDMANINEVISISEKELAMSYKDVNDVISKDKNPYITCRIDGSFIVRTPKLENKETYSLSSILPYKNDIPIHDVLSIINTQTKFSNKFTHDAPSMQHHYPEHNSLFTTLIAYGCNVGIPRMARITKGQNQDVLENIARKYMHIDNIKRANEDVTKKIDEITDHFISTKVRHTSSDGQKYNVDGCSLNANASYKYHGSGKGVSSYTFLDNRFIHFYATVISSSEREACYVLDGMMQNQVIKSDIHSTDTHGFTETVFGLMHMMGITFAPRLKNLSKQTLYGFKSSKNNSQGFIKPQKYINVDLIKENWDDILRFAATVKLNHTSASQLFKRLNSYSKQHILYKALKEFGRLRKTLFILRYMQDLDFRQAIEKQLNRGENSNKLSKAIAFGNNQEIMFEEKEEQEVAENCRQLIKNSIVLWNYLYLIKMLKSDDPAKAKYALVTLQKGNVLAWKHILLHGEYNPNSENINDNFGLSNPKIINEIHTKFWEELMSVQTL